MKMTKSVKVAQCLHSSFVRSEVKASSTKTKKKLQSKKLPLTTLEIQWKAPEKFTDQTVKQYYF